jgi:hypothetical protein
MHLRKALLSAILALPLITNAAEPAKAESKPAEPAKAGSGADVGKLTVDVGGFLQLSGWANRGGFDNAQLARFAGNPATDRGLGMSARQTRMQLRLGLPTDGLLGNAKLKGMIEADFAGAVASAADLTTGQVRLRHAFVSATWQQLGNLTVLVGQTWGIYTGTNFATSLAHIAMPRFGGAGQLFRRAPQIRVQGDVPTGQLLSFTYAVGALAPIDPVAVTGGAMDAAEKVGEHSGKPNVEARVAAIAKPFAKARFETGFSGHFGSERYELGTFKKDLDSKGLALDAKFDLPYVTLVGAAFRGENLDILYSSASTKLTGTRNAAGALTAITDVENVKTRGFFGQAQVSPVKYFTLLGGAGVETPEQQGRTDGSVVQNRQLSTGVIVNLTSKWKAGVEYTRYFTRRANNAAVHSRTDASQVEFGTMFSL